MRVIGFAVVLAASLTVASLAGSSEGLADQVIE